MPRPSLCALTLGLAASFIAPLALAQPCPEKSVKIGRAHV